MHKFDLSQLIYFILEDKCSIQEEAIDLEFNEGLFNVLKIGDDPDYPETELEIFLKNFICTIQHYNWNMIGPEENIGRIYMPDFDQSTIKEFNLCLENEFKQFENCLTHHCKGNNVKLQYYRPKQG